MGILLKILMCFTFLSTVFFGHAEAQEHLSGSGRNPPKKLSKRHIRQIKRILPLIPSKYSPYEIIAIGMVESSLRTNAVSQTGDYGLMQVNCRSHKKKLRKIFGFKNCEKDLLIIENNMKAALLVFSIFRKNYKQCTGQKVYACYNGGQGWKFVRNRCLKNCSSEKPCRRCGRPERYANSVKKHIEFLKKNYSYLVVSS